MLTGEEDCPGIKRILGKFFVEDIVGSHQWTRAFFEGKGKPLFWYPERAAIYHKEHGHNHSHRPPGKIIRKHANYRRSRSGKFVKFVKRRFRKKAKTKLKFRGLEPLKYRFNVPLPGSSLFEEVIKD